MLLRLDYAGQTVVDITPWDPKKCVLGDRPAGSPLGGQPDMEDDGRDRSRPSGIQEVSPGDEIDDPKRYLVYDYYDAETNMVFAEGLTIKKRMRHGAPSIPVYLTYTGGESLTSIGEWGMKIDKVGESIYGSVRDVYGTLNFLIGVAKQVVAIRRKFPFTVESISGDKTLDENPYLEGTEIPLKIGEKLNLLKLPELGKDFETLLQFVLGELQRGSLPFTAFGELAFQLSGYAINALREGIASVIDPLIISSEDAYLEISDKLCAQFASGLYPSISMAGEWDDLASHHVRGADEAEIKLAAKLPEDMAAQMQVATQMARAPDASGTPVLDDTSIQERILHVEDVESLRDRIYEQVAERLTPSARAFTFMEASNNRGNEMLTQDWLMEYYIGRQSQFLNLAMMEMQMQQMGLGTPMGGGLAGGGMAQGMAQPGEGPEGVNNAIVPQQALGAGQPAPSPQGGPNVPPGSPRPQARQGMSAQNLG